MSNVRFVGLDVHADTIAVAVAEADGEVRSLGTIPNRLEEDAKQDQHRARHRLSKFLLRHGKRPPQTVKKSWTLKYMTWIQEQVKFAQPALETTLLDYVHEVDHMAERIERLEKAIGEAIQNAPPAMRAVVEALQALRGVAQVTAVTVVAELGTLSRFDNPRQLMGYSGLVSSEHSSGNRIRRGSITKTGNAHLRRVIIESAWAYQHRPWVGGALLKRQQGLQQDIKDIAWKAQWRLHTRYKKLAAAGKKKPQIITAVGRELLGFIWAIAVQTEAKFKAERKAA